MTSRIAVNSGLARIFVGFCLLAGLVFQPAQAERLSLSGLKNQLDALDERLTECEQGIGGVCQGSGGGRPPNVILVAPEGGDFTSIQAAIDSVPVMPDPGSSGTVVTPTLIKIAPGDYYEQVYLRDNIRLKGAGMDQTYIGSVQNPNLDCVDDAQIICIAYANNVEISHLTVTGLDDSSSPVSEEGIAISDSASIRLHHLRITDVTEGINGQQVGDIEIRHNRIVFPADAIVLQMISTGETSASLLDNLVSMGQVSITGSARVRVIGNRILDSGLMTWEGSIQAIDNLIFGDIDLHAYEGSVFNGNFMRGTLNLTNDPEVVIVGNHFEGDGPAIIDNGNSTIVGNRLQSPPVPIQSPGGSTLSTHFGNQYDGDPGDLPNVNSLVSRHQIRLESREENVTIKAGDSTITVDAAGAITIDSATDINLTSSGKFTVDANGIELKSSLDTLIESTAQTKVKAGSTLSAEGAVGAELKSGGTTTVQGALVQIN